jgi:hypothetical protein
MSVWGDIAEFVNRLGSEPGPSELRTVIDRLASEPGPSELRAAIEGLGSLGGGTPAAKKDADKKKAKKKTDTLTAKEIEQDIAKDPWSQLGQALVSQYQAAEAPAAALASGSQGPTAQEGAAASALSSLGLSPTSSAAQWLNSQMQAAQETAAPVQAAMNAYGAQYSAEAGPITQALLNYAQANQLEVATAPEQGWLNALASHVTSNLSYYGSIPKAAVATLPPAVAAALEQSGGYPGSSSAGLVPLQDIKTTGTTSTITNPNAGTAAAALSLGGNVPSSTGVSAGS